MKNYILSTLILLVFSMSTFAQSITENASKKNRKNEIGLSISATSSPSSSLGIMYKRQIKENTYLRATGGVKYGSIGFYSSQATLGIEKRNYLLDNFYVNYGAELVYQGLDLKFSDTDLETHTGGFAVFTGLNYDFNSRFSVGAELAPTLSYTHVNSNTTIVSPVLEAFRRNTGMNLNVRARLNFLYKF